MLLHLKAAALAEGAIRVRYTGKYKYASLTLVVSTPAAPVLSLGVSDTSLAAAVSAKQTVITGDATLNHRDVIGSINNWIDTTAAREVLEGDFHAELYNSLYNDVFGGTSSPYAAEAGTTYNLKNTWVDSLIIDNDVSGTTSVMIPPPGTSKGFAVIKSIKGHPGTSATPTVTRSIYDMDGNQLDTSGAIATATDALLLAALPVYDEPVVFDGPVIVRDTCATEAHNDATTMKIQWGLAQAKNF